MKVFLVALSEANEIFYFKTKKQADEFKKEAKKNGYSVATATAERY